MLKMKIDYSGFSIKLLALSSSHYLSTLSPKATGKIVLLLVNLTGYGGRKDKMRYKVARV